jgi:Ricin-type beta-trefoil lectin domain
MSARTHSARRPGRWSRIPSIALLSLTALLFCAPQTAFASAAPKGVGDTGPIISGYRSTKCVTDLGNGTANDTPVVISACTGGPEQNWTVEADGSIQINGKCLDIKRDGKSNKGKVEIWTCHGGANQQWSPASGALVNPISNKCLDDPRFSTTGGTQLELYTCNGGRNQQWNLP